MSESPRHASYDRQSKLDDLFRHADVQLLWSFPAQTLMPEAVDDSDAGSKIILSNVVVGQEVVRPQTHTQLCAHGNLNAASKCRREGGILLRSDKKSIGAE